MKTTCFKVKHGKSKKIPLKNCNSLTKRESLLDKGYVVSILKEYKEDGINKFTVENYSPRTREEVSKQFKSMGMPFN